MEGILNTIVRRFNLELWCEHKFGEVRYDFYIPTPTPIVVEVNGQQHYAEKTDGFFFKDGESLRQYVRNDKTRRDLHESGRIKLYTYKWNEFPSVDEVLEELDIEELKKGLNDEVKEKNRKAEELRRERSRKAKEFRDKAKKEFVDGNRSQQDKPSFGYGRPRKKSLTF